jgi:hypothetical protein
VQFVEAVTTSHDRGGAWTPIPGSGEDYYVAGTP